MTKDMTVGNPVKLILSFSIPLLIGNLFQQFYSMVDTIIVGRFLGVKALAAVGATGCMTFLVLGFVMGLTSGFAVPIAQRFGANDYDGMRHYVVMSMYLCVITTVIMTALSMAFTKPLLQLMQTPEDIFAQAQSYILAIFAGLVATIFYNMLAGILRALGDSKTPLYFLIVSSVLNVILDLVFIVNFSSGVAGAAYATVIAQGISAILCLVYMSQKYHILKLQKEDLTYSHEKAIHLLKIGMPMALQFSVTAIGTMFVQSAINRLGSITVAAYTAASKVEQLAMQPLMTIGATMATYTGQNLGAGKMDRIRHGVKESLKITLITCVLMSAFMIGLGGAMVKLFVSADSLEVIAEAKYYLNIAACFFIPLGFIFIYRNVLQGLGDAFIPMLGGFLELSARVFVAFTFVGSFGYPAICFANPAAWVVTGFVLLVAYYKRMKKI